MTRPRTKSATPCVTSRTAPTAQKVVSELQQVEDSRELQALQALRDEMRAVIDHFTERPVITAVDVTEEDARWIMRYDRRAAAKADDPVLFGDAA